MERIKQAIEDARKANPARDGRAAVSHVHSQYTNPPVSGTAHHNNKVETIKKTIAIVMIFLAGWLWLRLDFMNELELMASRYIHEGIEQARAEVKKRLASESEFRQLIQINKDMIHENFIHCQEAAERDKTSYLTLVQNALLVKNEKNGQQSSDRLLIPKSAKIEANSMLESAKAECRKIYDAQLLNSNKHP